MAGTARELGEIRVARSATDQSMLVTLVGEIDMASRARLDELVQRIPGDPAADVAVDLSPVTFLGSAGLDFLVRLHISVTGAGYRFTVLNPPPIAQHALQSTGLDQLFTIADSTPPDP